MEKPFWCLFHNSRMLAIKDKKMEISHIKRLLPIILFIGVVITGLFFLFSGSRGLKKGEYSIVYLEDGNYFIQGNSIIIPNNPSIYTPKPENKKIRAILTAYSSSIDETWGDPYITASGERVRDGVIANNCLPFGTIVEIKGMYFEVLDRKNSRYGCEWFDIWQSSKQNALNFGIKKDYIKIY